MSAVRTWHASYFGDPAHPPVVCLHGFLGSGRDWSEVAPGLIDEHYLICPDLPYHGHTVADREPPMTCAETADALADWLTEAGISRFALAGYSMGGRIALHLALQHPDRITRLVLESATPGIEDAYQREQRRLQDARLARSLDEIEDEPALRAWLRDWYAQPLFEHCALYPERLARLLDCRFDNHPGALAASLRGMGTGAQDNLWPGLASLSMPVLLVTGESDRKFSLIAEQMLEHNSAFAIEVLAGCGHNVHWERPERYTAVLKGFLHQSSGATA